MLENIQPMFWEAAAEYWPYVVGGGMMVGSACALLPQPTYRNGFLTASGAKRLGFTGGDVPLGKINGTVVTAPKESFVFGLGPTGGGKTQSLIYPAIGNAGGRSLVVFDYKGDITEATAYMRSLQGPTFILDPGEGATNHYNPYADLPMDSWDRVLDLHSWIMDNSRSHQFYGPIAHTLNSAAAMHLLHGNYRDKTMPGMYDLLAAGDWKKVLGNSPIEQVRRAIGTLQGNTEKEINASISSVLGWLSRDGVRRVMGKSDFKMTDLQYGKDGPVTLYIKLPAGSASTLTPFARVIIGMLIDTIMRTPASIGKDISERRGGTIIIDEVKALALPDIGKLFTAARSFDWRLVLANQLLGEVRDMYGKTIEGNCTSILFFRLQDMDDIRLMSQMMATVPQVKTSTTTSNKGDRSVRREVVDVPLMPAGDIIAMEKHKVICGVIDGHRVKMQTNYAEEMFKGLLNHPFEVSVKTPLPNPWKKVGMNVKAFENEEDAGEVPGVDCGGKRHNATEKLRA